MRIEIKLRPAVEGTILPFNYNYEVYTQILEKIYLIKESSLVSYTQNVTLLMHFFIGTKLLQDLLILETI